MEKVQAGETLSSHLPGRRGSRFQWDPNKLPKILLNWKTKELAGPVANAQILTKTGLVRRMAMNISAVTGVAAAFEGARIAGQQQASATSSAAQTQRENDRQAEEVDLKKTDTVTQDQGASSSGDTGERRLNILV
jgi:hypothetical protein